VSERLRIVVLGHPELVVEREIPAVGPPATAHPEVRPLPVAPGDRAAGIRRVEVTVDGWVLRLNVESADRAELRDRVRRAAAAVAVHSREVIRAQIPGRVVRRWVEAGHTVEAGQRLLAIEAMKMENEIRAPRAGVISSIAVEAGQAVELGMELLILD
jgi:glutaconyl-CoA/methylmalonyl-CoA decarboxylase subunit gamma